MIRSNHSLMMTTMDKTMADDDDGGGELMAAVVVVDNFHSLEYNAMSSNQSIRWMDDVQPSVNVYHDVLLRLLRLPLLNRTLSMVHNRLIHYMQMDCIHGPMWLVNWCRSMTMMTKLFHRPLSYRFHQPTSSTLISCLNACGQFYCSLSSWSCSQRVYLFSFFYRNLNRACRRRRRHRRHSQQHSVWPAISV